MSVVYVCVYVWGFLCVRVCGSQKRKPSVLFSVSLSYFLETRVLTELEVHCCCKSRLASESQSPNAGVTDTCSLAGR